MALYSPRYSIENEFLWRRQHSGDDLLVSLTSGNNLRGVTGTKEILMFSNEVVSAVPMTLRKFIVY
jgi:hypothetical protein